jgi:transient receptor potential cation channel subfamily M protein 3
MLRTTSIKYLISWVSIATVVCKNKRLKYVLLYLFSFSIQKIQDETDQHWNFQRYVLIYEYYSKPPLPTPLILISHMFLILRWLFQRR